MVVDGGCAKRTVIAVAEVGGVIHLGVNLCRNPQEACPRKGMETGVGYDLCENVCRLTHAEASLIKSVNGDLKGADIYLLGHHYVCEPCRKALKEANCGRLVVLDREG